MLKQNTVGSNLTQRKDDETGRTAEIMAKKMGISNGRGQFAPSERIKAPESGFLDAVGDSLGSTKKAATGRDFEGILYE